MVILIVIGIILILAGLAGCIVPGLPGPPLSFLALILLSAAKRWEPFTPGFLLLMAALTVGVTVLDYVVPAAGARRYGASRLSFWLALLGMFFGIFFAPPWGIIIFTFLGAIIGELIKGKTGRDALRAGWGVFVGILVGTVLKLIASGVMTFYFIKALF